MISARGINQEKRDGYLIQPKYVSTKQKIVHDRGPSKVNPVIFVYSFEVFWVSENILLYKLCSVRVRILRANKISWFSTNYSTIVLFSVIYT